MKPSEHLSEERLSSIVTEAVVREIERQNIRSSDARLPSSNPRQRIIKVCRLIYARQLSDSAGGNVSLRVGDHVYITPRYMGEHHQWDIAPDDIILADVDGTVIEGSAERISREGSVHFGVYRTFPDIGAVIHAHPTYGLVFASAGREMPSVTAMAEHFRLGTVPLVQDAPPGSEEMALHVIEAFKQRRREHNALAVFMPNHGVAVAGSDIEEAYVILESIETNARVFLMRKLLGE